MNAYDFLTHIKQRTELLEQTLLDTPDDPLLHLRAKDVETSAHHMAREIKRMQARLTKTGVAV